MENITALLYLVSGVLFIMALRGLSHPETSRQGNTYGMVGMGIAILTTLFLAAPTFGGWALIILGLAMGGGVGAYVARTIPMTSMPQLVAGFHSLVGLAAVMVAGAALYAPEAFGIMGENGIRGATLVEMALGAAIGAVTFTGSVIAFAKLDGRMSGAPIMLPNRHIINIALAVVLVVLLIAFVQTESTVLFWIIVLLSFAIGILLIIPIGGADMPVVVSMLNSYSGWAAAGIGFTLGNLALIITGALVGSSGAILSYIMCKSMNRSFISVILNAGKVIIVPGYGMAVAQAQHSLRELGDKLKEEGVEVKYAIHPVAGRMPGHMNVLLAEANVSYDEVFELEDINGEFSQADVVYVIGANDVTNPAARDDPAGIDNSLFYKDGTMMLLGDAKKMTEDIVKSFD